MKSNTFIYLACALLFFTSPALQALSNEQEFQQVIIDSMYSQTLGENRDFWVRLPDNYQPNSDQKYAVIYLLDGFSLKSDLEAVYNNYWGHYLPHMILVGISNRENRTRDLTTSQVQNRRGSAMNSETGGAAAFATFIEKELIPTIDDQYPTLDYRTLIGHSYGGLFTLNMLVNYSHVFKNFIAIDPSLDWDNQKLLTQAKAQLALADYSGKSLFVSLAAEQLHMYNQDITMENIMSDRSEFTLFARSIIDFCNTATAHSKNGLNFSWKVYPEDLHGTVPLPSIRDGLVAIFNWYQFKSPQKYNNPETPIQEISELLKTQEAIYTTHFGVPTPPMVEELLNGYGYMYLQMGMPDKAYMFFELNITHYPKSANAYDSMAEYYESQNDKANALINLKKALSISGSDYYKERIQALTND